MFRFLRSFSVIPSSKMSGLFSFPLSRANVLFHGSLCTFALTTASVLCQRLQTTRYMPCTVSQAILSPDLWPFGVSLLYLIGSVMGFCCCLVLSLNNTHTHTHRHTHTHTQRRDYRYFIHDVTCCLSLREYITTDWRSDVRNMLSSSRRRKRTPRHPLRHSGCSTSLWTTQYLRRGSFSTHTFHIEKKSPA